MADDAAAIIAKLEAEAPDGAGQAIALVAVAEMALKLKQKEEAARLARQGLELGRGDARVIARGRKVLHALLPGYHAPMMNDARRNMAWDAALRRAIRPGMHVYEIGTGAGMLAMMAARAGAEHVTTCEFDPVVADLARELIAHNGYGDRVTVLTKRSQNVTLDRRADLLFCDIFADGLFDFDPIYPIADAKARLLTADAVVMPRAISMWAALVEWSDYDRSGRFEAACGFDLSPMRDYALVKKPMPISSRQLYLRSAARQLLQVDLTAPNLTNERSAETVCEATDDGLVNGFVRWIRLELDDEVVLEARPEPDAIFFSGLNFIAASAPAVLQAGDRRRIQARQQNKSLETWLEDA